MLMCGGGDPMPSFGIGLADRQEHLLAFHVYKQNGYTMSATNPSPYKPDCPTHYVRVAWSCELREIIRPFLCLKTDGESCKITLWNVSSPALTLKRRWTTFPPYQLVILSVKIRQIKQLLEKWI
jgi:hypothetical protein